MGAPITFVSDTCVSSWTLSYYLVEPPHFKTPPPPLPFQNIFLHQYCTLVLMTLPSLDNTSGMKLHHAKGSLNHDCLKDNKGDEWKCVLAEVSAAIFITCIIVTCHFYACSTCLSTSRLLCSSSIHTMMFINCSLYAVSYVFLRTALSLGIGLLKISEL